MSSTDLEEPVLDLELIRNFCVGRDVDREVQWEPCLQSLSMIFDPDVWVVSRNVNPYGPGAHTNLFNVECGTAFRAWLTSNGVHAVDYADYVGPTQYVSVQAQLRSLSESLRGNQGWRLRLMGFPAIGVIALGLGTHYQGTQNHAMMGAAAGRLRDRALEVLGPDMRTAMDTFPSATHEHWDDRGLMIDEPALAIGDLDVSDFDGGDGVKLRMIRNTTVKKELAAFFGITGMSSARFESDGEERLIQLHDIACALGTPEPS